MEKDNYKNILVPYDFSKDALAGLQTAITLASDKNYKITLLNVIDENRPQGFDPSADATLKKRQSEEHRRFIMQLTEKRLGMLEEIIQSTNSEEKMEPKIEFGGFVDAIETCLEKYDIDLVVMGSSGETSVAEFYKGSHATRVRKVADVPVLIVKAGSSAVPMDKIMVVVEFRDYERRKLRAIQNLADDFSMKVYLSHIPDSDSLKTENVKENLSAFGRKYSFKDFESLVIEGDGDKSELIRAEMNKREIPLVAVIAEVNSNFIRLFTENETKDIIEELEQPILSVTE